MLTNNELTSKCHDVLKKILSAEESQQMAERVASDLLAIDSSNLTAVNNFSIINKMEIKKFFLKNLITEHKSMLVFIENILSKKFASPVDNDLATLIVNSYLQTIHNQLQQNTLDFNQLAQITLQTAETLIKKAAVEQQIRDDENLSTFLHLYFDKLKESFQTLVDEFSHVFYEYFEDGDPVVSITQYLNEHCKDHVALHYQNTLEQLSKLFLTSSQVTEVTGNSLIPSMLEFNENTSPSPLIQYCLQQLKPWQESKAPQALIFLDLNTMVNSWLISIEQETMLQNFRQNIPQIKSPEDRRHLQCDYSHDINEEDRLSFYHQLHSFLQHAQKINIHHLQEADLEQLPEEYSLLIARARRVIGFLNSIPTQITQTLLQADVVVDTKLLLTPDFKEFQPNCDQKSFASKPFLLDTLEPLITEYTQHKQRPLNEMEQKDNHNQTDTISPSPNNPPNVYRINSLTVCYTTGQRPNFNVFLTKSSLVELNVLEQNIKTIEIKSEQIAERQKLMTADIQRHKDLLKQATASNLATSIAAVIGNNQHAKKRHKPVSDNAQHTVFEPKRYGT